MATGVIIHISVGSEKRTEFFSEDRLRIGSDEGSDLQLHTKQVESGGAWFDLERTDGVYRVIDFDSSLGLTINDKPIRRYVAVSDGDVIKVGDSDIAFAFFALTEKPSLITTSRKAHVASFIEDAALDAAATPERDDAKAFLREFTRELMSEISLTTKLITLVLAIGFIAGVLYIGYSVNNELEQSRIQGARQNEIIKELESRLGETNDQLGQLDKTSKDIIRRVSLAQNLRVDYGGGVALIVGVYDLVERRSGKVLRYPDPDAYQPSPYEPPLEEGIPEDYGSNVGLTTFGNGLPVEYDFIGTGFHVGGGFIVTNKHVLQPWTEDDNVKLMMRNANGRARIKSLVVYFPNIPEPFPLKIRETGSREDVAVASTNVANLPADLPVLPLEDDPDAAAMIGKTVVSMGYPNGPDRLLAMVDDSEAKALNSRFGNSRQDLIKFLGRSLKIVPLTTQGAITDLDTRRIVHDARTAEGGSGAPLFGQTGKVIGVNFGVFTENTAVNLAVPVKFAITLLQKAGWERPPDKPANPDAAQVAETNTNAAQTQK